ncbi:hypothetical protein F5141DRAFT_372585 [Pisolithus sp. B1]|nr:hypothetical protein F5141DRAFT_372585 [Pisolithus sp. B1]
MSEGSSDNFRTSAAAASAQRKRIEELIRTRGPLIHRLPVEILSSIFHLALRRTNPSRKDILACVSRHWRNIILDQPSFWSTIEIASSRSLGRAKKHLKKSREIPLDITIRKGFLDSNDTIREELDLLVPFANRWRSLSIFTRPDSVFRPAPRSILDCIGAINFPSLRCVKLDLGGDTFPTFLSSTNVPVLEHLEIRNFHLNLRSMSGTPVFRTYSGSNIGHIMAFRVICYHVHSNQTVFTSLFLKP